MRTATILALSAVLGLSVGVGMTRALDDRPRPMKRLSFECSTDAECAALPPCKAKADDFAKGFVSTTCDGGPDTQPYRLVGYDCAGASEPLYRDEEDQFPRCGAIEATFFGG